MKYLFNTNMNLKVYERFCGSVNLTINTIAADTLFLVLILTKRNRTSTNDTGYYGLHLYFLDLSYRNRAKALSRFVKQSHVVIWNGFKNTNLKEYRTQTDEERYWNSLSIKHHKTKHIMTTFGYGLQLNLATNQFLIFIFSSRKKHVCCREFSSEFDKQIWKAFSFYRYYGTWYPYACNFSIFFYIYIYIYIFFFFFFFLYIYNIFRDFSSFYIFCCIDR